MNTVYTGLTALEVALAATRHIPQLSGRSTQTRKRLGTAQVAASIIGLATTVFLLPLDNRSLNSSSHPLWQSFLKNAVTLGVHGCANLFRTEWESSFPNSYLVSAYDIICLVETTRTAKLCFMAYPTAS